MVSALGDWNGWLFIAAKVLTINVGGALDGVSNA